MLRRALLILLLMLAHAAGQTPTNNDFPRNAKGQLQPFVCSKVFLEPGKRMHLCDPVEFGKVLRAAKTAIVAPRTGPPLPAENLSPEWQGLVSEEKLDATENRNLAEKLIRGWDRFRTFTIPMPPTWYSR